MELKPKRRKIVVDPDKANQRGSTCITFRAKEERVFLHVFVDSINKTVYSESPIEDSGVRARVLRYARIGAL